MVRSRSVATRIHKELDEEIRRWKEEMERKLGAEVTYVEASKAYNKKKKGIEDVSEERYYQ